MLCYAMLYTGRLLKAVVKNRAIVDSIKKLVKHHVFKLKRAFLIVSLTNVPWLFIRSHALHDMLKK